MIGSTVALKLLNQGHEVTVLDALLPLYGGNFFNLEPRRRDIELLIADIRDEAAVRYAVQGKDVIFNLAAQVSYVDSMADPLLDLDINCRGQLTILEACRRQELRPMIVFASSRMVYGAIESCPVSEEHPTVPLMPYAIHKLTGEKYHLMYYRDYGVPGTIARVANPYGPRQQMKHSKYGMVNWFIRLAIEDQTIRVFGDGQQLRDYIYVDDIADALIAMAVSDKARGQVYNVGSGVGTPFIEMAKLIALTVGKGRVENIVWPPDYLNIETGDYVSDISRIRRDTGWYPKTKLEEGIRLTYEFYSANRHHYW